MTEQEAAKVREVAQEAFEESFDPDDLRVMDDQPVEKVDHGYWVVAKLWVPIEWVEGFKENT
jgi:hypothetical protein